MKYLIPLVFFIPILTSSQPWMKGLSNEERNNFYNIQQSYQEYIRDKDKSIKGTGWKQFERWQWFWESRILEDGSFPGREIYDAALRHKIKDGNPTLQNGASWKTLGPDDSPGGYQGLGRVNVVRAEPDNNDHLWAGAASGGLWYSTDAGVNWECLSDEVSVFEVLGVSDIAFDPNNSDILYVASGDRDAADTYSSGLLKSTDGGESWFNTDIEYNVEDLRVRVNRVIVHPTNTQILYVASSSGIYKSTNGGNTFENKIDGHYVDMEMKPDDPEVLYASGYNHGIFKTEDGGDSWTILSHNNLPDGGVIRTALAVTRSDPDYLVALMSNTRSALKGVYRSTDAGTTWKEIADETVNYLGWRFDGSDTTGQGWYDLCIAINPTDSDEIYIGGINTWKTTNGGEDWEIATMWDVGSPAPVIHADQHDFWFTDDGNRLLIGNDGGVYKTDDGETYDWIGRQQNITQFYRIAISQQTLDMVIGGSQDNGTKLRTDEWRHRISGDGMECMIYPTDDSFIMGASQNGHIEKSTNGGQSFRMINSSNGRDYDDIDETGAWITPYAVSPTNKDIILAGFRNIWRSVDGGEIFTKIEVATNTALRFIEYAPSNSNTVYAGTNSQFWYSSNGGITWTQMTRPGNQSMTCIEVHPSNPDIVYATNGNWNPENKVFRSTDRGQSWENLSEGLPNLPANCIFYEKDSDDRIYVGTDIGLYYRDDNSGGWQELNNGLPNVIVSDIELNYEYQRLYVGTYGRGVWYYDLNPSILTPNLVYPDNEITAQDTDDLVLEWTAIQGADRYRLQISSEEDFSNIIFDENNIPSNFYEISNLNHFRSYYWRVKTIIGFSESEWSEVRTFRTKMQKPTLSYPPDLAVGQPLTTKIRWADVDGAESYELEVSDEISFENMLIQESLTASYYEISLDDNLSHFADYFWRVKAIRSDEETNWSDFHQFSTIIGQASLDGPEDGILNYLTSNTLSWEEVNGASSYDIEISINEQFSTIDISESNLTNSFYFFEDLALESQYFWRVRGSYQGGKGQWSSVRSFYTMLEATNISIPENESFSNEYEDLTINWNTLLNPANFNLQLSKEINFQNLLLDENGLDVATNSFKLSQLEESEAYFVRVQRQIGDRISAWSKPNQFITKINSISQIYPEDLQNDFANGENIIWEENPRADEYQIQISTTENFLKTPYDEFVSKTEFKPISLNSGENYFWRVRSSSFDRQNLSDWSEVRTFTTIIGAPNLLSPANNYKSSKTELSLNWDVFNGATEYELNVSIDQDFSNIQLSEDNIQGTNYSLENLDLGTYFWRVRANPNTNPSKWSAIWKFIIQDTSPNSPILSFPINGASTLEFEEITFNWFEVQGAVSYRFELSENQSFVDLFVNQDNINTLSYTVNDLKPKTQYWWRVSALNDEGLSVPSNTWSFSTKDIIKSVLIGAGGEYFSLYPNPASNQINLRSKTGHIITQYSLINTNGKKLLSRNVNSSDLLIDLTNYPPGIYLIKFQSNGIIYSMRFNIGN